MYLLLFLDLNHSTKQQFQVSILVTWQNFQNLDRQLTTNFKIYSKFGRYKMPAKEAIQFNFLLPHALSEMIKGTLKYSFSVPRFSLLFITCYFSVLGSIMTILLSTQSLKSKLYMKKHWRSLSEEGKMNAENGQ